MMVYRLASGNYANDLSGTGSKLYGGRWNSPGLPALYTTEHISLAILEILVHVKAGIIPSDYHLISIEIPLTNHLVIDYKKLKNSWKDDITYTRFIGDEFLRNTKSAILKVPSVIINEENNFIINPFHADASKIILHSSNSFSFDKRLHLKNE